MLVSDIDRALTLGDVPTLPGHSSQSQPKYISQPTLGIMAPSDPRIPLIEEFDKPQIINPATPDSLESKSTCA